MSKVTTGPETDFHCPVSPDSRTYRMRRAPTIPLLLTGLALLCFIAEPTMLPGKLTGTAFLLAEGNVPQQEAESSAGRTAAEATTPRTASARKQPAADISQPGLRERSRRSPRVVIRTTLPPPPEIRPSSPRAPPAVT